MLKNLLQRLSYDQERNLETPIFKKKKHQILNSASLMLHQWLVTPGSSHSPYNPHSHGPPASGGTSAVAFEALPLVHFSSQAPEFFEVLGQRPHGSPSSAQVQCTFFSKSTHKLAPQFATWREKNSTQDAILSWHFCALLHLYISSQKFPVSAVVKELSLAAVKENCRVKKNSDLGARSVPAVWLCHSTVSPSLTGHRTSCLQGTWPSSWSFKASGFSSQRSSCVSMGMPNGLPQLVTEADLEKESPLEILSAVCSQRILEVLSRNMDVIENGLYSQNHNFYREHDQPLDRLGCPIPTRTQMCQGCPRCYDTPQSRAATMMWQTQW